MIVYEKMTNGLIKAQSNSGKYLNETPSGIMNIYEVAINKGTIINGVGVFDNGNTYTESSTSIQQIEETSNEQEQ